MAELTKKACAPRKVLFFAMVAGLEGLEPHYDFVIVGAGLSGFVFAEQAAARFGYTSLIIDKRDHIGALLPPPASHSLSRDARPAHTAAQHRGCLAPRVCARAVATQGSGDTTLQVRGVARPFPHR